MESENARIHTLQYIIKSYNKQAHLYDELHGNEQMAKYHIVLKKIAYTLSKVKTCLDCGCGTGLLLGELTNLISSIVGFDISGEMLKQASRKVCYNGLHLIRGDSNNIPIADGIFDLIFAFTLLDGEVNGMDTLIELRRTCSPHGILVVSMLRTCPAVSRLKDIISGSGLEILEVLDIKELNEIILILKRAV